jgi:hypothetical protein
MELNFNCLLNSLQSQILRSHSWNFIGNYSFSTFGFFGLFASSIFNWTKGSLKFVLVCNLPIIMLYKSFLSFKKFVKYKCQRAFWLIGNLDQHLWWYLSHLQWRFLMSHIYSNHGTFVMFKSKLNILWFLPLFNVHGGSPKVVVGTWILNSHKINHIITILIVLWKNKIVLKKKGTKTWKSGKPRIYF